MTNWQSQLWGSAALAAILSCGAARAHEATDTLRIDGYISESCGVRRLDSDGPPLALGAVAAATEARLEYRCNAPGGFTRTIRSQNGGALRASGADTGVPYQVSHRGAGLSFGASTLAAPIVTAHADSAAFRSGQVGDLRIDVAPLRAPVFAGSYRDSIEIVITPNS